MSGGGGFDELSRFLADLCDSAVGLQESTSTPYLSFSASSSNRARISQGAFIQAPTRKRRHARQDPLPDPICRLPSLRDLSTPAPQMENMFCFERRP